MSIFWHPQIASAIFTTVSAIIMTIASYMVHRRETLRYESAFLTGRTRSSMPYRLFEACYSFLDATTTYGRHERQHNIGRNPFNGVHACSPSRPAAGNYGLIAQSLTGRSQLHARPLAASLLVCRYHSRASKTRTPASPFSHSSLPRARIQVCEQFRIVTRLAFAPGAHVLLAAIERPPRAFTHVHPGEDGRRHTYSRVHLQPLCRTDGRGATLAALTRA
ncbi:hypothetical protein BV20DRAFT_820037 [Pilatotrama ljubarskyi]|nr:hypothetical protein BV20DRAFT_820037 [Pilatotrama ljubarskyi]